MGFHEEEEGELVVPSDSWNCDCPEDSSHGLHRVPRTDQTDPGERDGPQLDWNRKEQIRSFNQSQET